MGLNKYGRNFNEEPTRKFDLARRGGNKGAALYQQHCVGCDENLKTL
jgi:hypothetical protein